MAYKEKYIPTGNEMISIPAVREKDAAIMGITFLHMGFKGMVEIKGEDETSPLLKPFIAINGVEEAIDALCWERLDYWIPRFRGNCKDLEVEGILLAPVKERGFIYTLKVVNKCAEINEITIGLKGCWSKTVHEINESKDIDAAKYVYHSNWNNGIVFDLRDSMAIFSFAPFHEEEVDISYKAVGDKNERIDFTISKKVIVKPDEESVVRFFWGFGFEEVGSTTAAKEMVRKGFESELDTTRKWLADRIKTTGCIDMDRVLNTNLFFNFFFASGITLDTEEFVLVTSRSPRYYVSAAYWDRDSLYWSFPSILLVDGEYAKGMLEYVFIKQIKNVGVHSRYIDGTVLEPGFELDELCAPVLALHSYVQHTGDYDILNEDYILKGIDKILKILETKKHKSANIYETFLQPTDDMNVYPYLTYDNVLVWKAFKSLAELYAGIKGESYAVQLLEKADKVKKAIWDNCVVEYNGKRIFAWSVDLKGKWNIYDEPPGSLQLLPFHSFSREDDPVYLNTIEEIRKPGYPFSFHGCRFAETGCEHAPHPWILSVANSLLCGRKEHCRDILLNAVMDNGIACESIDENTGECTTGEAFATCAGFLAYAVHYAFAEKTT